MRRAGLTGLQRDSRETQAGAHFSAGLRRPGAARRPTV